MIKKQKAPIVLFFIFPIFITFLMISQWDSENSLVMIGVLVVIWIIAIAITVYCVLDTKKKPYPFCYLVDKKTLIDYMNNEDKFSNDNNLEASFHYHLYQDNKDNEIRSWHNLKTKIITYYFNKEEIATFEELTSRIKEDNQILIQLCDSDNKFLNEYRSSHTELDISGAIDKYNSMLNNK